MPAVHPDNRPAEIEPLFAVHREDRRHAGRAHGVEQLKRRRLLARERGHRGAADMRIEHHNRGDDHRAGSPRQQPRAGRGKVRERNHERQRVASCERLLEQQVEHEIRAESRRKHEQRPPRSKRHRNQSGCGEHQDNHGHLPRRPRRDERVVQAIEDVARAVSRPQHLDVADVR